MRTIGVGVIGCGLEYRKLLLFPDWLPESLFNGPKQGFVFPLGYWMKGPLLPVMEHLLTDSELVSDGIFRSDAIRTLVEEHVADRADHHVRLWLLLNLLVWYRMYIGGESKADLSDMLAERVRDESSTTVAASGSSGGTP